MSTLSKVLLGCACGCLVLLTVGAVGCVVFFRGVSHLVDGAKEAAQDAEASAARLKALDAAHPSPLGVDMGTAEIDAATLDRYLRVRAAIQPLLASAQAKEKQAYEAFAAPGLARGGGSQPRLTDVIGGMSGVVGGMKDLTAAQSELRRAMADALEAEGMGPTELLGMAEIVEWRFLRRPEAIALGLPEWQRSDLRRARAQLDLFRAAGRLEVPAQGQAPPLEELEKRIAGLETEASQHVELAPGTAKLLEERRAELAALPGDGIGGLWGMEALSTPFPSMAGAPPVAPGGGPPGWNWSWSTTTTTREPDGTTHTSTSTTTSTSEGQGESAAQEPAGESAPEAETAPTGPR